jgi:hypothetical protein
MPDSHDSGIGVTLISWRSVSGSGADLMKDQQLKKPSASPNSSQKTKKQKTRVDTHPQVPVELGGPKGPEPTRYGDWEKAGRCTDF